MPRVALLIPTGPAYGRSVLRGVAQFARQRSGWTLVLCPWIATAQPAAMPAMLRKSGADAVLIHVSSPRHIRRIAATGLPAINVTPSASTTVPTVQSDNAAVGRLAAEHLLERGIRRFAYLALPGQEFSRQRWEGFRDVLGQRALDSAYAEVDLKPTSRRLHTIISRWKDELARPFGLFACFDLAGRQALIECIHHGLRVPEDVAVLGADNDDVMCDLLEVPMSSVDLRGERIGYEAAALLQRILDGQSPPAGPILIAPAAVVARRSSDVLAVGNSDLARALRFIHDNAGRPITIDDVLRSATVSRRGLERLFRHGLGRTIRQEIYRVHLEKARELLVDTDLRIENVARQAGFRWVEHFCQRFRGHTGLSPARYRRSFRIASV